MQTRVKITKEIEKDSNFFQALQDIGRGDAQSILVVDAEIIFLECKPDVALLVELYGSIVANSLHLYIPKMEYNEGSRFFKPIAISRHEVILDGDWVYYSNGLVMQTDETFTAKEATSLGWFKVLVLEDGFSQEHLESFVDSSLLDGDIFIECELKEVDCPDGLEGCEVFHQGSFVKLDSSNHIILHKHYDALRANKFKKKYVDTPKVEIKNFTLSDMKKAFDAGATGLEDMKKAFDAGTMSIEDMKKAFDAGTMGIDKNEWFKKYN